MCLEMRLWGQRNHTIRLCFCSFGDSFGDWGWAYCVQLCSSSSFLCCLRFALRLRVALFLALLQAAQCSFQNSDTSSRCNCSPGEAIYSVPFLQIQPHHQSTLGAPSFKTALKHMEGRELICAALDGVLAGPGRELQSSS